MKAHVRWVLLGTWGLVVACAAAPFVPRRLDCDALRLASVNATRRFDFHSPDFSILPPQGEHWCIAHTNARGVQFVKNLLSGQVIDAPPSGEKVAHTFIAAAIAIRTEEKIESTADLRGLFERLMFGAKGYSTRYKLLESKTVADDSLGADCLRYDLVWEERDNPRVPGVLLITTNEGYLCRHPHSVGLIHIFYSERHPERMPSQLDPLRREVEPFVKSVVFIKPS